MSEYSTYECPLCDLKLMSSDAEALADEAARHKDYHVLHDEFTAKLVEQRAALADQVVLEELAEINIADDTKQPGGGGARAVLEFFTHYDSDGIKEGSSYNLRITKARGANNDTGVRLDQIPDLIAGLAQLYSIWKCRVTSLGEVDAEKAGIEGRR